MQVELPGVCMCVRIVSSPSAGPGGGIPFFFSLGFFLAYGPGILVGIMMGFFRNFLVSYLFFFFVMVFNRTAC